MCHTALVPLLFTCVVYGASPVATRLPDEEAGVLIDALQAGIQQWKQDVSIRSTYTYRMGVASLPVDLDTGNITPVQVSRVARGVLYKLGRKERISITYDGGLQVQPANGNDGFVQGAFNGMNSPREIVSDGEIQIEYHPLSLVDVDGKTIPFDDKASISRLDGKDPASALRGHGIPLLVTPLLLTKLYARTLDRLDFADVSQTEMARSQVIRLEDDEVEVVVEGQTSHGEQSARLVFWMTPSPPVIKSFVRKIGDSEERCVFADFRECPGGFFPRQMTLTVHSPNSSGPVMFKEWTSTDLGDQEPTPSDFVLTLPATTRIRGLRVLPPVKNGVRQLNIDTIDEIEVAVRPQNAADIIDPSQPPRQVASPAGANRWMYWVAVNVVFMPLVMGCYIFFRQKRKQDIA